MASKMTNFSKNRNRISPYPDHQSSAVRRRADSLYAQLKEFRGPSNRKFLYPSIHAHLESSGMQNISEEEYNIPSDEILSCKPIEFERPENILYGDSSVKCEQNISQEEYNIPSDEILSYKTIEFECLENILHGDSSPLDPVKVGSGNDNKSDYIMRTDGMYCGAYTVMLPNEPIESHIDHQTHTSSMDINLQNAFHQKACSTGNTAWSDITDGSSSDNGASTILSRSSSVCSDSVLHADSEHYAAGPVLCTQSDDSHASPQINIPPMDANLQNISQQQFCSMENNVPFPIGNNANIRTDSTSKCVSSENIPCEDSVAADQSNIKPSDIMCPGSTVSIAFPTAQSRLYQGHLNAQSSLASTNANSQYFLAQNHDVLYTPIPMGTRYIHADIGVSEDACRFKSNFIPQEEPGRYSNSPSHFSQQIISSLDLQGTINTVGGKLSGRMEDTLSNTSAVCENPRPHSRNPMHLLMLNPNQQIHQSNTSVREMTFTMPMDEGPSVILKRIDFSRQLHSSKRKFHLGPGQYKMLMSRSDLEIQLKCLRVERNKIDVAWPQSVSICVNDTPLGNEYLECTQRDKASFYFKSLCHLGDNTLKFKFSPNAFKFAFGVQIVKRVSLEQAVQRLREFSLRPLARSVSLIKKNFTKGIYDQNVIIDSPNACIGDCSITIQSKRIKVSLICRLLGSKIQTPARGVTCKHLQCFDLATYLRANYKDERWRCPECNEYAPIERLEIDEFYGILLTTLNTINVKEVIIDSAVNWWPVVDDEIDNNNKGGTGLFIPNCNNIIIGSDGNIKNAKCAQKEG
ncbi:uncharacterized protein LOC119631667 [Glossina fuscipes]|uniref:Uncharacterized protein LOC119631667 n=1 Tax=Glossina fuscipes TaxID=7396 RepID=A0A8U0W4G3_9MUSC|nr:uncharacterized protein LOC119631667 [Glossina fuscipes]